MKFDAFKSFLSVAIAVTFAAIPCDAQRIVNGIQTQHWAQQLTPEVRNHDFGVVPSFSSQAHIFEIENKFDHPIYLTGVRASCGCTRPKILDQSIQPGQTGRVLAQFDTRNFRGDKKATVSVSVRRDQPYTQYGEVQFWVKGRIRRDVVLNPGAVSFDDVTYGEDAKRNVQILYAGNPRWKIMDVKSTNPNISVETKEIQRNAQTKRIDYEMTIGLSKNQDIGSFLEQIIITTNDVNNKHLTVNIQGAVKAVVQVAPVRLGVVSKDQKVEKRLIIRGERPFGIKSVSSGDARIKIAPSTGSKTLHILTYRLDTSNPGNVNSKIMIETDDPNQKMTSVAFEAQIVPATFASDK